MNIILTNAFSINMFPNIDVDWKISFKRVANPAALILENYLVDNLIGHVDTDRVVRNFLSLDGVEGIPEGRRETLTWAPSSGVKLLVAQYSGPRLLEGTKTLPEGAKLEFWLVG